MQEIRVVFLCLGNICRSPLAEGVFTAAIADLGDLECSVESAGTAAWHVGKPPHEQSVAVARRRGIDISRQRAQQLSRQHLEQCDVIVAMDASNRRDALEIGKFPEDRLLLLRDFDPSADDGDVPDPYGFDTSHYDEVFDILERSMPGLIERIRALGPRER